MEYNWNMYPPGGRVFTEGDGTLHRADSWRELFEKIRRYREVNKRDIGDIEREVSAQLCAKSPSLCRQPSPAYTPRHHSQTHNQRVLQWYSVILSRKRVNAIPRVEDSVAADRAVICSKCPLQRGLNAACEGCIASVKTSRKAILDGKASQHQNLSPCAALGEDCTVSVHIQQPPLAEPNLPENCWRKAT